MTVDSFSELISGQFEDKTKMLHRHFTPLESYRMISSHNYGCAFPDTIFNL